MADQAPMAKTPAFAITQPFLASFLGLAAIRVWMQSNYFGSYAQSDAGFLTIANQLFYGLAMLAGALIAIKRPFTPAAQNALAWTGCVLMTLSTLFLLANAELGASWAFAAAAIVGGIGGAFGGATWIGPYMKLGVRQAIFYGFLSLALGSLGGLALSFMAESSAYMTSMFMPAISLLCFQQARKANVARGAGESGAHCAAPKPVYDGEPRKTQLAFLAGFAIFGLALGISRGFPMGDPVELGAAGRIVHQLGVVAISLFIVWWACVRRNRLSFIFLWRIEVALVALGMLLLSTLPDQAAPFAIAIVNIADTLMLGVMWVTLQDVSRHSSLNALSIYGFAWAARVLARDVGRVAIVALGASGIAASAANVIIGIVVFALAMSMALLLSGEFPQARALFDCGEEDEAKHDGGAHVAKESAPLPIPQPQHAATPEPRPNNGNAPHEGPADTQAETAEPQPASEPVEPWLKREFGLSNREAQVAALIAQGRSKTYIAELLVVSDNTVRTHAKNAYAKLGVHSNQELIDLVRQHEESSR